MRLVLIKGKSYMVYEGRKPLAEYILEDEKNLPTKEEVEELRLAEYKESA